MTVTSTAVLDPGASPWYLGNVAAPYTAPRTTPTPAVTAGRKRRRPPSLTEQARRTNRIRPWAEHWKQLKAAGQWR